MTTMAHKPLKKASSSLRFALMTSVRYLRPSRQDRAVSLIATLSFLGVTIGIAALIIVMSVMNGFRAELLHSILGFNGHIAGYAKSPDGIQSFDEFSALVREMPGVTLVTPKIESQAIMSTAKTATGIVVNGVRASDLEDRKMISSKIVAGSLDDFHDGPSILIGKPLARSYGLYVGDRVTLISPQQRVTAFGTVPRTRTFYIKALFEVGMYNFDRGYAFIPLEQAQSFFNYPESVNGLEIFTQDPENSMEVSRDLAHKIRDLRFVDWQQVNASFFNTLAVERNVMFTILFLIVLVAVLNIASSMIMLVKDKTRDIAILRTIGATKGDIIRMVGLVGAYIGFLGMAFGTLVGVLFCYNIETIRRFLESLLGTELFNQEVYFLSKLPAELHMTDVVMILSLSTVLIICSTMIPALRAAKLDPVEALRYE